MPGLRNGASVTKPSCANAPLVPSRLPNWAHARKLRPSLAVVRECAVIRPGQSVDNSSTEDGQTAHSKRSLTLGFEGFAWKTIDEEAAREGLTIEEFVTFSVLYYLADVDSGRVARRVSLSPYPGPTE